MHDNKERVDKAVGALKELFELHCRFMQIVSGMASADLPVGVLNVENNELKATCLGIDLSANHRFVVRNRLPSIVEYSFKVRWGDEDIDIFNMYLETDNSLYKDPHAKNRICDYDNRYLCIFVLNEVALQLLDSPVFAMKQDE